MSAGVDDQAASVGARDVLVVDDSALIRHVVQIALSAPAWRVLSADSGPEALLLAAESHLDAILLDVEMPGLDGPATLERLRAAPRTRETPVVFMTGHSRPPDCERLCSLGAAGVVGKPFHPAVLAELLSTTLGWRA